MTEDLTIRSATSADRPHLRQAIVELQEFERLRHSSRLPGEQIADAYLEWMLNQASAGGIVLVAESDGRFVGFIAGWVEDITNIAEMKESVGNISDICVMPSFRGQRIATQLLDAIEEYFRGRGVRCLRITSLAANASARAAYECAGFVPYEIDYEKVLGSSGENKRKAGLTRRARLVRFQAP